MPNAETARLIASLELKDQFTPGVNKALGGLGKLDAGIAKSSGRAFKAGQQIGTGIKTGAVIAAGAIGFLATQIGFGLRSLTDLESKTAQTNAVLTSTKGVAGQTAESIRNLAEKYEGLNATIDDKVIQSGENVLLTFTNIRKQAFEPALAAALDLSTAMGTDLQGSIVQVGKALSDPVKGITALTRVGVTFTQQQKDQIKALVKTGDTLGAQKIILAELNKEFGGSFLAGGNTTAGKVAKFQDSIEDLQKALATALLPTIGKVADGLSKFLADPQVVKGVSDLGKSIAGLFSDSNLKAGGDFLKGAFQTAKEAAPVLVSAAKATFGIVQAAVGLFKSLPPEIQGLAVGAFAVNKLTGGLVTNIAGGIIETVGKQFLQRGGTPANPLFVSDVAGLAGKLGGAGVAAGATGLASTIAGAVVTGLTTVVLPVLAGLVIAGKVAGVGPFASGKTANRIDGLNKPAGGGLSTAETRLIGSGVAGAIKSIGLVKAVTSAGSAAVAAIKAGNRKLDTLGTQFSSGLKGLRTAIKPVDVRKAVAAAVGAISKGRGNVENTGEVLSQLKRQLKNTHDPALARILRSAIGKVESKLPGRQFAARELAKADQILRSSKTQGQKTDELKRIQRDLLSRGLPHAASVISAKVEAAKRAQVAAEHQIKAAVDRKKLSVTTNVSVPVAVTMRSIINGLQVVSSYGHTAVARGSTRVIG